MAVEDRKIVEIQDTSANIILNLNTGQDAMTTDVGTGDLLNALTIGQMITRLDNNLIIPAIQFTYDKVTTAKVYQDVGFNSAFMGVGSDNILLDEDGLIVNRTALNEQGTYQSDNVLISTDSGDKLLQATPDYLTLSNDIPVSSEIIDMRLSTMGISFSANFETGLINLNQTLGGMEVDNNPGHVEDKSIVNNLMLENRLDSFDLQETTDAGSTTTNDVTIDKFVDMVFNDSGLTFSQAQGLSEVILMQDTLNSTQVDLGFASNGDGLIGFNASNLLVDKSTGLFQFNNGNVEASGFKLKTGFPDPIGLEGLIYWDDTNQCPAYYNEITGISNQIGQELWKPVRNVTGSLIPDGSVVYINGEDAGFPTIDLAKSDSLTTASGTIGFATHDIPTDIGGSGVNGFITTAGTVRGLNTAGCTAGSTIYLSDTTAGAYTDTAPVSPSWIIRLGVCGLQHASTGTIEADINIGDNRQIFPNFFNGVILGDRDVNITSDGATVKATLEAQGGGDLDVVFDGVFTTFDATPLAEVTLTAGTDILPVRNFVYILESTNTLTANQTGWPTAAHAPILDAYIGAAGTVQTKGASKHQEWTEHFQDTSNVGHLLHIDQWIREQPATYVSGITPSFSGTGTGTVGLSNTTGTILQMHLHDFPVISDPAPVRIINDSVTANVEITNLGTLSLDSTGTTLNNSTFAVVLWAVVNEYSGDCKWYANLPSGSYGASKPGDARNDASGFTNYNIPSIYKSNSVLVHRLILARNAGGTVTTVYSGDTSDDLRGKIPNTTVGGGGGGVPGLSAVLGVDNDAGGLDILSTGSIGVGTATPQFNVDFGSPTIGDNDIGWGVSSSSKYAAIGTIKSSAGLFLGRGVESTSVTTDRLNFATAVGISKSSIILASDGIVFSAKTGIAETPGDEFLWSTTNRHMTIANTGEVLIGTGTVGGSILNVTGLPTSAAGLSTGDVWNNSGVLNIV